MSPTPNVLELVRREDAAIQCKDKLISTSEKVCNRTTLTYTFIFYYKKRKKSIPISLFINSDRLSSILTNRWTSDIL